MDFNEIFGFVKDDLIAQWPFLVASILIGHGGQFAKTYLWTQERARGGGFHWWMRATLTLHAPAIGALFGVALLLIFGDDAPVGKGVKSNGQVVLYYLGAGSLSSLVVAAVKKFAEARGWKYDTPIEMPGDSEPPDELSPDELPTRVSN